MTRHILSEPGDAADAAPPTDVSAYLLERPERMLAMLDLMEKFGHEGGIEMLAGREGRIRHAP